MIKQINSNVTFDTNTNKYTITHNGIEYKSMYYNEEFSDEECEQLRNEYNKKPTLDKVHKEFHNLYNKNGSKISDIKKYYMRSLMDDVKLYHSRLSINEFIESNNLIRLAYDKIIKNLNYLTLNT